jgi:hypothetical protein
MRRYSRTSAVIAVATATVACARHFDGYDLNFENAAAMAVTNTVLYKLQHSNEACDTPVTSLDECAVAMSLSRVGGSPAFPEKINSARYPGGCFVATDPVTSEQGEFFNSHPEAANTESLSHASLCRTGATIGDIASASWCKTSSTLATSARTESACAAACVADSVCKGIAFDRSTSTCTHMGTNTYSFVFNASSSLLCARAPTCVRDHVAAVVELVDVDNCYENPRLNQVVSAQESCFEKGCAKTGALRATAPACGRNRLGTLSDRATRATCHE